MSAPVPPPYQAGGQNSAGYPPYPAPYAMAGQPPQQQQQPGFPMANMPPPAPGFAPMQPSAPGYGGMPGQPPVITAYPPPPQAPNQYMQPTPQQLQLPINYAPNPNVPPGLEYLTMIDQLLVKQKVEMLEAFIGFETNNKYSIKNSMGQSVFYAVEENNFCTRNCLGASRPFEMIVMDNNRTEVLRIYRPFRCSSCCCPCFLQELDVKSVDGRLLGSIEQNWSLFGPKYTIKNGAGDDVLRIEGPWCTFSLCGDVEFDVLSLDRDTKVGRITKQWTGLAREMFTDADYFGVTFPLDLDVQIKAVLLAATFLIDFMFFEQTGDK